MRTRRLDPSIPKETAKGPAQYPSTGRQRLAELRDRLPTSFGVASPRVQTFAEETDDNMRSVLSLRDLQIQDPPPPNSSSASCFIGRNGMQPSGIGMENSGKKPISSTKNSIQPRSCKSSAFWTLRSGREPGRSGWNRHSATFTIWRHSSKPQSA